MFHSSTLEKRGKTPNQDNPILIFFCCWLKLSIITPMKRFRVKNEPKMIKTTK